MATNKIKDVLPQSYEQRDVKIIFELNKIAAKFSRSKLSSFMQNELTDDIIKNWGEFGIKEIGEAFRLWSIGEIGNGATELYGGELNALVLNRVLKAYSVHRAKIVGKHSYKYRTEQENKAMKEIEKKKKEEFWKEFKKELPIVFKSAKSWEDIPTWYWKVIKPLGIVTTMQIDDFNELLNLAETEASKIIKSEYIKAQANIRSKKDIEDLKAMQADEKNLINQRMMVIAGQMTVFENMDKIETVF